MSQTSVPSPPYKYDAADVTDEQILSFEQTIKDHEANKQPLVNVSEDISALYREYETNTLAFKEKISRLQRTHRRIRRCRGDGNCFYRAFAFAWFNRLHEQKSAEEIKHAGDLLKRTCELLDAAGFQKLAYEDFYDVTIQLLSSVPHITSSQLLERFQTDEISNAIVVHFRFVTSAFLKLNAAEYAPFLDFSGSMDEFCAHNVEAMGREVEQIQIIALSKATDVIVKICYLSGSNAQDEVNFHEFSPDIAPNGAFEKPLTFLHRPGHYDMLE